MRRFVAALCAGTCFCSFVLISATTASASGVSSIPRPDHIVIVLEENKASQKILGNPDAPYINSLATSGANMAGFFAETHPSQPNYLALFSGSTQGVTDDSCPHTFGVDNLGSELIAAGDSFTGYSESLPSAGYTGCTSGLYARKHSPWVNFSNLPSSANQPFTSFPSEYSQLPDVSFVIPNLDDDMHNGTIAQGDTWLQNNLGGYVTWAQTHNSVLALTFDEDDHSENNQIPTMLVGQPVQPGSYPEQVNHYNLLRTIEDAYGIAPLGAAVPAAPIADIWNPPAGDQPPVADFSLSCSELTCSFDGSATDPDGTIASYSWNFGDGEFGSGASISHTYASAGTRPVTLTVTDDQGGSSSATHPAGPTNPAGATVASDGFGRSVPSGWGSADQGGAWSLSGAGSSVLSVAGGTGQMRLTKPGSGPVARLAAVSAADVNMLVDVSVDKVTTGAGLAAVLVARHSGASEYRLRLRLLPAGAVHLALARVAAGTSTTLRDVLVPSVTYAAGQVLRVRFVLQRQGQSTAASASVWDAAGSEPAGPQLTVTDSSTAVTDAGSVGIQSWLASNATNTPVTASYDNFAVTSADAGQGGQNQPPTAAFTSQCTQLSCQFDASGSSDSDGTITGYDWQFGDSSSGSGAEPAHAYAAGGTYSVTLKVTDSGGATDSVSHAVTVSAANQSAVASDAFDRSVPSGWGAADQGGAWSLSGVGSNVLSVSGGTGQMRLTKPGAAPVARLAGTSATDVNMLVDVSVDKVVTTGSELAAVLVARHSGSSEYRLRLRLLPAGVVHLAVARVVSGSSTTLRDVRVPSLSYAAGQELRVRFVIQSQGQSTAASASVWDAGSSEPVSPQLTVTDSSTAVAGAGSVGIQSWLAKNATNTPVTVSYDNFAVTDSN